MHAEQGLRDVQIELRICHAKFGASQPDQVIREILLVILSGADQCIQRGEVLTLDPDVHLAAQDSKADNWAMASDRAVEANPPVISPSVAFSSAYGVSHIALL